jgi:thiosulfate/3-mercaptopyruvate sulfurtransferase
MRRLASVVFTAVLALSPLTVLGDVVDAARSNLLVSVDWLAEHVDDPDLVLLHVGEHREYRAAHIPGARHVSLEDISVSDHSDMSRMRMLDLPAADDLHRRLSKLGIDDHSRVVVYFGDDWVSPATRVVFTLDAAGLGERSALLDGGMRAWKRAGNATTKELPGVPKPASLSPLQMQSRVVDADFVQSHLDTPGYVVIDGRAASLYDGVDTGGDHSHPHKTGHIAGAKSLPYTSITGLDLKLKSAAELRALFDAIGVKPGDTVIGYCHIGQQATAMLFAARSLGHRVFLYDGSFEDWSQRDLPVTNPSQKSKAP